MCPVGLYKCQHLAASRGAPHLTVSCPWSQSHPAGPGLPGPALLAVVMPLPLRYVLSKASHMHSNCALGNCPQALVHRIARKMTALGPHERHSWEISLPPPCFPSWRTFCYELLQQLQAPRISLRGGSWALFLDCSNLCRTDLVLWQSPCSHPPVVE